ncbi:MAG: hypothetical protein NVSMB5_12490 [Candidatus Velthaea sp.]
MFRGIFETTPGRFATAAPLGLGLGAGPACVSSGSMEPYRFGGRHSVALAADECAIAATAIITKAMPAARILKYCIASPYRMAVQHASGTHGRALDGHALRYG